MEDERDSLREPLPFPFYIIEGRKGKFTEQSSSADSIGSPTPPASLPTPEGEGSWSSACRWHWLLQQDPRFGVTHRLGGRT
uniref:Uncharacterized protein n=1 Tax=Arundo donax TaxID=35708 RepID=A0A0A9GSV8_ARUDO